MSYLYQKKSYKKIILNTEDAIKTIGSAVAGTGNSEFTFMNFNTITIKEPSYLKIDAVSADITSDSVWNFKLDSISYNQNNYYKVIFNGTPDKFLEVMSDQNYNFEIKNKIWILNDKS